jgi:hypothetical protein
MAEDQQPEIPQEMRELALQNIDQARAAYSQLIDAARRARQMIKTMAIEPDGGRIKTRFRSGNEVRRAEPRCEFRHGQ